VEGRLDLVVVGVFTYHGVPGPARGGNGGRGATEWVVGSGGRTSGEVHGPSRGAERSRDATPHTPAGTGDQGDPPSAGSIGGYRTVHLRLSTSRSRRRARRTPAHREVPRPARCPVGCVRW